MVQNVKQELIGNNINPMIIENLECNDNASNVPNRLLKDNSLFQQSSSASSNVQINNINSQKAPHPMGPNSQNHYLIQSLQSDPRYSNNQLKENQPLQGAPCHNQDQQNIQQRFYTDSPIQQNGIAQQMQPGSDTKKSAKARKSVVPKNPNTPKRRKTTICSKEKINMMPINSNGQSMAGSQSESLSENIASGTSNCLQNEPQAKKQRKVRNSISSMTSIGSPSVQPQPSGGTIQIQQVPANFSMLQQEQLQTSLGRHSQVEANNISQQNIQIQNIANDLLRVCGCI